MFYHSVNYIDKTGIIIYYTYINYKKGGEKNMDIIQKTVSLFSDLIQRIRTIGDMLVSTYLPTINEDGKTRGLFWIFNW